MLFEADKIPSTLIYSDFSKSVPAGAFRQNFEFLAYYLCRIDSQRAIVTVPASAPPESGSEAILTRWAGAVALLPKAASLRLAGRARRPSPQQALIPTQALGYFFQ